ncbi:major facilitator superfamily transporter SIT family siderophore-iron:H+ symporter [Fusarium mundagurra]|uniref:Major facilitator superfamily transporter SIT family siderophore-iron:H+ symporter n=1 Tax=Fusarium mundagurra TaxID=1567541 RepID=A0A8H5YHR6_9HYPO|nr:major facilitator superfamily transporter SIT family siderophore-iron:H+ symporter [Fusarium mundagurra]
MEKDDSHGKAMNIEDTVSNSASVLLYDDHGNVRSLPVPSTDLNDPLNFGIWRQRLVLLAVCMYGIAGFGVIQSTPLFFGNLIADYMKETRGTFHPDRIADLASYPSLCMGLGNFFFVPLSMALGRRFAFILSNIIFVASIIWAAKSQSFGSHLGARCLQGLTAGISDCLLPIIVLDMSFLYKRSARLIAYWAFTAIGSSILLIPIPFIIENAGGNWRLNYWFWLAFAVFAMILIIFCVPETLFNRRAAEISGKIHATDAYGTHRTFASPQAARDAGFDIDDAQPENPTELSYKHQFALFTVQPSPVTRLLGAYKDIFLCVLVPGTLWVLLFNSMVFGGLVVLSLTYAQRLEMPPWSFSPEAVGTVQIGAAIGAVFGLGYGELAEPISRYLTKRNGGVRETEHVLPNFILPSILCFLGMIIYGVVAADPAQYSWVDPPPLDMKSYQMSFVMRCHKVKSLNKSDDSRLFPSTPGLCCLNMQLSCFISSKIPHLLITNPKMSSETAPLLGAPETSSSDVSQNAARPANPKRLSAGVARMAVVSKNLTRAHRIWLFTGIFLVGYAYGLESQVRLAYQSYATSSFDLHSYLSTINVLRNVIAVAVQPTAAKVADVFGRFEVIAISTVLYTLGIAIESTAPSVEVFCTGSVIYQTGYTCIVLLLEVLIADFSSMRARVFFSYLPAIPFLINTWISGNITSAVLSTTTWRWGLGMWAIIYPIASLPLLSCLYFLERKTWESESGKESDEIVLVSLKTKKGRADVFHQLDIIGLVLLVLAFSLILAPLTVAGGTASHWRSWYIILPLVLGFCFMIAFITWEQRGARHPLVPFHLLRDRGVWSALAVRSLLNLAWCTQGNYLYTILIVAFDFSIENATRIISFFSFFGVITGVLAGLVIFKIRRLKFIIVGGTLLFMVAFGVLILYPGGASTSSQDGIIAAQILLGVAGGFFAYPTQASIQASATREHVAILTGLYLSFYNVGSALGTCLSGAIWTQTLYKALKHNLDFQPDETLAKRIYNSPFAVIPDYPVGTAIRDAIISSYSSVQRLLCIAGICVCIPMIIFALALRNPRLSEQQVQTEDEENHED